MEFRLIIHQNLYLLASLLIESVAHGSVDCGRILVERHIISGSFLHVCSTADERFDVESGNSDRQQAHRSEHREASADIVGDDECLVTLLCRSRTGSTLMCVCDCNDNIPCLLFASLLFALLLQKAESKSRFRCRSRLGDIDNAKLLVLQEGCKFGEIVLTYIVSGKYNCRVLLVVDEP